MSFEVVKINKLSKITNFAGVSLLVAITLFLNLKYKKLRKEVKIYEKVHEELN